jgi:hypothetical protein
MRKRERCRSYWIESFYAELGRFTADVALSRRTHPKEPLLWAGRLMDTKDAGTEGRAGPLTWALCWESAAVHAQRKARWEQLAAEVE